MSKNTQLSQPAKIRHDWDKTEILSLFQRPFNDLLFQAHSLHRQFFKPNDVQISTLLNIKTGACPEDCSYCPQSARHETDLEKEKLMAVEEVVAAAKFAKKNGSSRFCMGAAWRELRDRDLNYIETVIKEIKAIGLETCVTLGMVKAEQAKQLKAAGLDYYNHNIDTSVEFYEKVITTRTYEDRLKTLDNIRDAGINVCCGGIVGMGEDINDRAGLLMTLANMATHPESVPINLLVKVKGTPLENAEDLESFDFIRTVAVARILMPASTVRLSAGRADMNDEMQALCYFAGANSVFYGEKLLTTPNPDVSRDQQLFNKLGINFIQTH
ncbi:MAG: biotin synthase BioB [Methylococcales bacterium]|jgi:biotin synthase|nr:biotin synthase BioB [Methylococcales bacterium]MBT7409325.1 biotin synthase BioB [Methylococcales bacterium]